MKSTLFFLSILVSSLSYTQNSYTLNANNASAIINSEGFFLNDPLTFTPGYGMVSDSGAMGIYFSSFWIGGLDSNDSLHTGISHYASTDLKSGPIATNYYDVNYLNTYDQKIWLVTADEISYHIAHYYDPNYTIPNNILNWPANGNVANGEAPNLAMYSDWNGNGYYDPQNGDFPIIRGDRCAYLIFNDDDAYSADYTMGFEYHYMFYQYASNDDYLNNTTFLRLTIFNRSGVDYHNVRVAQYVDFDIGGSSDDYIGCDSTRDMIFGFNGDSFDDSGNLLKFGANPPAFGVKQLNQPMDVAIYYNLGGGAQGDPTTRNEYWLNMNGYWRDNSHITYGGTGYGGNTLTNYMYSGNPYTQTGWTEASELNPVGDRRMFMSTGSGTLNNFESVCVDYAYIYARDGGDYLANVNSLYSVADSVQDFYNSQTGFYCPDGNVLLNTLESSPVSKEFSIYPNPNNGSFTINFEGKYNLKVYSINGQLIENKNQLNDITNVSLDLNKGLYIVQIEQNGELYYQKVVIE